MTGSQPRPAPDVRTAREPRRRGCARAATARIVAGVLLAAPAAALADPAADAGTAARLGPTANAQRPARDLPPTPARADGPRVAAQEPAGEDPTEQEPVDEAPPEDADTLIPGALPADTRPEAADLWRELTGALRDPDTLDRRIEAFAIRFDLRARSGPRSNDVQVSARFLAPDFVAFTDAAGRQVGVGPDGPWLEERDGAVVRMRGREYRQDRRNLARTRNLARNYLALTDPGRIRIESLRRLAGVPPVLPEIRGLRPERLEWLELVTPDFGVVALPPEERAETADRPAPPGTPPPPPGSDDDASGPEDDATDDAAPGREPRFRVRIGCDPRDHWPVLITIRSAETLLPEQQVEHCIHLREYRPDRRTRGLLLPWVLDVYERWPSVPGFARFPEVPSQEIWLIEARVDDLGLTPESFVPAGLREEADRR